MPQINLYMLVNFLYIPTHVYIWAKHKYIFDLLIVCDCFT